MPFIIWKLHEHNDIWNGKMFLHGPATPDPKVKLYITHHMYINNTQCIYISRTMPVENEDEKVTPEPNMNNKSWVYC